MIDNTGVLLIQVSGLMCWTAFPSCTEIVNTQIVTYFGNIMISFPTLRRSPVDSPNKGQWREALMFSLICAWTNNGANSRYASDLKRRRTHYDVTVMNFNLKQLYIYYFITDLNELLKAK